jgi:hypothetical protein
VVGPGVWEAALDTSIVTYIDLGLAGCGLALGGWVFGRRSRTRPASGKDLLTAAIKRQSPRARSPALRRSSSGNVPSVVRPMGHLASLERHLRTAIFDPGARERLVGDALRSAGGDRAAAIREVLSDLENEHKRWS